MWLPLSDNNIGIVIYPFNGTDIVPSPFGLELALGDTIALVGENNGWLVGRTKCDKLCAVPGSYIYRTSLNESVTEVTTVAREWGEIWKRLYRNGSDYQQGVIGDSIRELVEGRRLLLNGNLTKEQSEEWRLKLANKIDWGNRKLGLDLVPRDGYTVVTGGEDIGVVKLYRHHVKSVETAEAARTTLRKKRSTIQESSGGHHLFMTVRDFNYNIGEDCEIFFALYDATKSTFISERHVTVLPSSNSVFIDKIQTISTLFTDLCTSDFSSDLFIVTHIFRVGRMFYNDSTTKKSAQNYRRPFASGALNLTSTILNHQHNTNSSQENEHNCKLYNCDEKDFWQIHELILKGSSKVTVLNCSITLTLKLFQGDVNKIREENAILFKNIATTDKIGFPDVIMPGVVRNDLYITIQHGEFEKSGKTMGGKNISVTVLVLDSNGNHIENGVLCAVNQPTYESFILYHNNNPKWNEIIKIKVPIEKFPDAHIRIEYRHCSSEFLHAFKSYKLVKNAKEKNEKKLFGFSFIKLMDGEGTIIKDTAHSLPIYKCEDNAKLLPSNYFTPGTFPKSAKETISITTHLVSTKLTQNMDLVSLLKWKSHPEKVKQTLIDIAKLPGEEIVKFLQDVLDVLFAMFVNEDGNSTEYSGEAFVVLLNIFTLLEDSKFEHFKPVIDAYIHDHFAAALVYKGLLSSVTHYAATVPILAKDRFKQIKKCFKTSDYIFKFAVQSQILFARATGGNMEDSFRRDVSLMFDAFNELLTFESGGPAPAEEVVSSQSTLLLHFRKIYTNLMKVYPLHSLSYFILGVFSSITLHPSAHSLSPSKLRALCHLVESDIFKHKNCRTIILPEICKHIRHHLSIRDELKLTSDLLLAMLDFLHEDKGSNNQDDIEIISTNVLEPLINAVLILERTSTIITPLVVTLVALYQQMSEFAYNRIFDEFKDTTQIRGFILRSVYVFRDLIKFNVFLEDWFKMKLLVNSNILRAINNYSSIITSYFLKPKYDADLFLEYFHICFSFILQPCLQLEEFRDDKMKWVVSHYSDMRIRMCREMLNVWNSIEERIHFVPALVGPILHASLSPLKDLANFLLPLIIDLLDAQFRYYGDFHVVESELIDKLDTYIMDNKGSESYVQTFYSILTAKLDSLHPSWQKAGHQLISSIKSLLEILIDYRMIPNDPGNREKKMNCINNLLTFYKNVNLQQMYIKYIHKLNDLHVSTENYVEAGFTLLLHADLLDFQNDYEVKEQIHLQVIKYFDQGKLWERGVPLCKELATIYETKFDYTKLSNILVTTSTYFNNILTQHRPEPEYFRVSFIGLGFPLFVRNKEFIYRGYDYERITSFVQRIVSEWPDAEVLKNFTADNNNLINSEGQYLQIRSVKPLPSCPQAFDSAPARIKSYFNWNDISKFQYDHSLSKNMDDVGSIHIERTVLETTCSFPGILRTFLVKSKVTTVLTPIKFAVEKMIEVNKNLEDLLTTFSDSNGGAINVNPLSMRLQGILDANVQGGLPKYQEAFFTPEFLAANPENVDDVNSLNRQILSQIEILDRALTLHASIISPGVLPLHNRLVECFNTMKVNFDGVSVPPLLKRSDSLRVCSSIINTPLPPLPTSNGATASTPNNNTCTSSPHNNHRLSTTSGYGYINPTLNSEDEDFYSIPSDNPPPIPNRKKKLAALMEQQLHETTPSGNNSMEKLPPSTPPPPPPLLEKSNNINRESPKTVSMEPQSEYIIMPPNRLRELNGTLTPPRPPKNDNDVTNGTKTPPPVPPKPNSNRDSSSTTSGTGGDRRSCNSNSSGQSGGGSSSNYKEFFVLPVKK